MSILDAFKRIAATFVHPVGVYDASPPTIEDGDVRPLQIGPNGGLLTEAAAGASSVVDTELPAAAAPTDSDNNTDVPAVAARLQVRRGDNGRWQTWTIGQLPLGESISVTIADDQPGFDGPSGVVATARRVWVSPTYSWTLFAVFGAATKLVKDSAGNLRSVVCANRNGAARYLQLHNTSALPAADAVPVQSWFVPAGGNVQLDAGYFGDHGVHLDTGVSLVVSSVEGTYVATGVVVGEHSIQGAFV
jgi:hypothetical protein